MSSVKKRVDPIAAENFFSDFCDGKMHHFRLFKESEGLMFYFKNPQKTELYSKEKIAVPLSEEEKKAFQNRG